MVNQTDPAVMLREIREAILYLENNNPFGVTITLHAPRWVVQRIFNYLPEELLTIEEIPLEPGVNFIWYGRSGQYRELSWPVFAFLEVSERHGAFSFRSVVYPQKGEHDGTDTEGG